jgi:NADH-quinone oxidoreductase subunit M
MVLLSILSIPFIAAIILLFVKPNEKANYIAIASTGITLALALNIAFNGAANFDANWIPSINARFVLSADGLSKILILLTAISFPAILWATANNEYKNRIQYSDYFYYINDESKLKEEKKS